jgi:hypothetical protein
MDSGGMIYTSSFVTVDSGIQVVLRLLHEQLERLQYWYYWWDRFINYAVEMASGVVRGDTHTEQGDLISLLLIFQNKKSKLKLWFPRVAVP